MLSCRFTVMSWLVCPQEDVKCMGSFPLWYISLPSSHKESLWKQIGWRNTSFYYYYYGLLEKEKGSNLNVLLGITVLLSCLNYSCIQIILFISSQSTGVLSFSKSIMLLIFMFSLVALDSTDFKPGDSKNLQCFSYLSDV